MSFPVAPHPFGSPHRHRHPSAVRRLVCKGSPQDEQKILWPQVCREAWSAIVTDDRLGNVMRAGDLAEPYPTVALSTPALDAARLLAGRNLPGLIVVDDRERPATILPGTQVLRMAVPRYCQDDPTLARVVDEAAADVFLRGLGDSTVAESVKWQRRELPVVDPDATVLEVAALMARTRCPLVAVCETDGALRGAITLAELLGRTLGP
jgi:CBS domain-containing protein